MTHWSIERLATCTSTMDEARVRLRAHAPHGVVVVAEAMTAGRGQHGHAWHAPVGGLYLSILLRDMPARIDLLTLAIGNAVADALEVCGVDPQTKWVNDVLVGGRKVAGVLCEVESTADVVDAAIIGIGINANGDAASWPDDLAATATTLEAELGCDICLEDLEATLLSCVDDALETLTGEPAAVAAAFQDRHALTGTTVTVGDVTGRVEGIAEDGALILMLDGGGERRVRVGEVSVATRASASA